MEAHEFWPKDPLASVLIGPTLGTTEQVADYRPTWLNTMLNSVGV